MANGALSGGRAVGAFYGGRAVTSFRSGAAASSITTDVSTWPRSGACGPPVQCCCKGSWNIGPGERLPLIVAWSPLINSVPGYTLSDVSSASLMDMNAQPIVPADPEIIKVTSGKAGVDETELDNEDVSDQITISPTFVTTQAIIEVSPKASVGKMYRLNICVMARDCEGHDIRMCDCYVISIAQC